LGRLDGAGEGKDTDVDEIPETGLPGSGATSAWVTCTERLNSARQSCPGKASEWHYGCYCIPHWL